MYSNFSQFPNANSCQNFWGIFRPFFTHDWKVLSNLAFKLETHLRSAFHLHLYSSYIIHNHTKNRHYWHHPVQMFEEKDGDYFFDAYWQFVWIFVFVLTEFYRDKDKTKGEIQEGCHNTGDKTSLRKHFLQYRDSSCQFQLWKQGNKVDI